MIGNFLTNLLTCRASIPTHDKCFSTRDFLLLNKQKRNRIRLLCSPLNNVNHLIFKKTENHIYLYNIIENWHQWLLINFLKQSNVE